MTLGAVYIRCVLPLFRYKPALVKVILLNLLLAATIVWEPILLGKVIDALSGAKDVREPLIWWGCLAASSTIFSVILARSADRIAHVCRSQVLSEAYGRVLAMPVDWHERYGASQITQTLTRGCESQFCIWLEFMRTHLSTFVALILLVPTALNVEPVLGGILLCLGLAYWCINRAVMRRTKAGQRAIEHHYHDVFAHLNDTIHHVALLHSYNRVRDETALLCRHLESVLRAQLPVLDWWALASILNRLATTISMGAILLLGSHFVRTGAITLGELTTFIGFAGVLISRLDQIRGFVNQIHESSARLEEFLRVQKEAETGRESNALPSIGQVLGKVEFRNVSFTYHPGLPGIHDVSFVAEPGQIVAIVGTTGAGKSTLMKLLQRMYKPTSGQILIDDMDIANVSSASVRDQIAVVSQESDLLSRSIAENIKLARDAATMEEIRTAARAASADRFIEAAVPGYLAHVGDNGAKLSGGERQRIAIARAILKSAPILIFDEATSALDVETEASVKDAIDKIARGRTTFIIAHRLSTVRNADLVLVMREGRIVERGTYAALSQRGGHFARLLEVSGIAA
jgi:ATP-binding cassette, subfamily B, beta-glucan exporter